MSNSKQFIIANMASGPHDFEVHSVKCGDLRRKHTRRPGSINNTWRVTGATAEECVAIEVEEFQAQEQDWTADHFHIFSCCKDPQ